MAPPEAVLPDVLPNDRFNARGMPVRELRDELRRIPNVRNAVAVTATVFQSFGVVIAAAIVNTWWAYLVAFFLMARGHVCLNILGHEAAHRILFSNRKLNDTVGRFLSYSSYTAMLAYRRVHFAHHRDELGPDEPDLGLYAGYPVPRDSWHRKLRRDLTGESAYKNFKGLFAALKARRTEAILILALHVAMLSLAIVFMRPVAYLVWILSWSTLWKFSNRLRAIAEHGGMERSRDRRRTTHVIRQSRIAALLDGALQHGLAPRAPRRHGGVVDEAASPPRRARGEWLDHARTRIPELPGVLEDLLRRVTRLQRGRVSSGST